MARSVWTGVLSFGLVTVPVKLYTATEDHDIKFHQLNSATGNRIKYRKTDEGTGAEVAQDGIVKGFDLGSGEHAVIGTEELKALAPEKTGAIEITEFTDLADVDPVYFDRTYYIGPGGKGADRAYALLHRAMARTGKAGIATVLFREKEHLCLVRAGTQCMILQTLHWADEVRDPETELSGLPGVAFEGEELEFARKLITSLGTSWAPERHLDTYQPRVMALIEAKRDGRAVITARPEQPGPAVTDLMDALRASIKAAPRTRQRKTTASR
jgi:DNA end-binding protein Ku